MLKVAGSCLLYLLMAGVEETCQNRPYLLAQNTYCHLVAIEGIASLACAPFTIMLSSLP